MLNKLLYRNDRVKSELSVMDVTKTNSRIFQCSVSEFDQSNHKTVHPALRHERHVRAAVRDLANQITDGAIYNMFFLFVSLHAVERHSLAVRRTLGPLYGKKDSTKVSKS